MSYQRVTCPLMYVRNNVSSSYDAASRSARNDSSHLAIIFSTMLILTNVDNVFFSSFISSRAEQR